MNQSIAVIWGENGAGGREERRKGWGVWRHPYVLNLYHEKREIHSFCIKTEKKSANPEKKSIF